MEKLKRISGMNNGNLIAVAVGVGVANAVALDDIAAGIGIAVAIYFSLMFGRKLKTGNR